MRKTIARTFFKQLNKNAYNIQKMNTSRPPNQKIRANKLEEHEILGNGIESWISNVYRNHTQTHYWTKIHQYFRLISMRTNRHTYIYQYTSLTLTLMTHSLPYITEISTNSLNLKRR